MEAEEGGEVLEVLVAPDRLERDAEAHQRRHMPEQVDALVHGLGEGPCPVREHRCGGGTEEGVRGEQPTPAHWVAAVGGGPPNTPTPAVGSGDALQPPGAPTVFGVQPTEVKIPPLERGNL